MKTMTCRQLGGACDKAFHATSFEELAKMSKRHGMEMYQQGDESHIAAMSAMRDLMKDPEAMKEWFHSKQRAFDMLPED